MKEQWKNYSEFLHFISQEEKPNNKEQPNLDKNDRVWFSQ